MVASIREVAASCWCEYSDCVVGLLLGSMKEGISVITVFPCGVSKRVGQVTAGCGKTEGKVISKCLKVTLIVLCAPLSWQGSGRGMLVEPVNRLSSIT